jgi:RNA polymerase sigma factor (sigma-70 family)
MSENTDKYSNIHRDILEKCLRNDRKAQLELYRLYSGAIYNTCLRILKNTVKAEDAMQESFILAFQKLGSFKGESSFGAWLKRIAINKSVDEIRKNKIQFEMVDESVGALRTEDNVSFDKTSDDDLIKKVNMVKQAMQLLPDGYRIVLSLNLFEGYDHEEIGQILHISESTSRSQYSRARQKLVELLTDKFQFRYESE